MNQPGAGAARSGGNLSSGHSPEPATLTRVGSGSPSMVTSGSSGSLAGQDTYSRTLPSSSFLLGSNAETDSAPDVNESSFISDPKFMPTISGE